MTPPSSVRLDKWLWAVRAFKTRNQAAQACHQGRVLIQGRPAKASHDVVLNELINMTGGGLTRTFRVLGLLARRVGASLVHQFAADLTPAAEYERARAASAPPMISRPKGLGRPTKRDRRQLEKLF